VEGRAFLAEMRAIVSALVLAVIGVSADGPKLDSLTKLEALVSSMAAGQSAEPAAARKLEATATSDVVILEEQEHRRQLSDCDCKSYANGAQPTDDNLCIKISGKRNEERSCRPYFGGCMSDHKWCTNTAQPSPYASNPSREMDELGEMGSDQATYVNFNVQLSSPTVTSYSGMPPAESFAAVFAAKAGVTTKHVQAQTAFEQSATVHATVHVKNAARRMATETLLREMERIAVDGTSFEVSSLKFFPALEYPLVCTPESEAIKADSAALMQQLVELKQQELELLRAAVSSGQERCSPSAMQALAKHINTPLK